MNVLEWERYPYDAKKPAPCEMLEMIESRNAMLRNDYGMVFAKDIEHMWDMVKRVNREQGVIIEYNFRLEAYKLEYGRDERLGIKKAVKE